MRRFDLFSIGHSNTPIDRFVGMLRSAGVNAVADVRSKPVSRHCPWFSAKNLVARLQQEGMLYLSFGEALGGRPRDPALYCDGTVDYEAMAKRPEFSAGLDRLLAEAARHRICLICAEREPLDCHRGLLVARALAERDLAVGHILHDGTIEPHTNTEQRLLAWNGPEADVFVTGRRERLAAAYRRRTPAVAYRAQQVRSRVPLRERIHWRGDGLSEKAERQLKNKGPTMCAVLRSLVALAVAILMIGRLRPAHAQNIDDKIRAVSTIDATPPGTVNPKPLPPLANPNAPDLPATELFARKATPAPGPARPIGSYANGCLVGAESLPIAGPTWQVMRLSRNRNWGTPRLVQFLERLGDHAKKGGWNGLLVGDMGQPRGGPMPSGHASHQIGLDVDIWFTPMPDHVLSREEREKDSAVNVVAPDGLDVDQKVWTHAHMEVVKAAAEDPDVARIFVNAAIKKKLCSEAGTDRGWLAKVRPWWGHAEHFHVRLACPPDARECKDQRPVPPGDGCGHALDFWFKPSILNPPRPKVPPKPRRQLTLVKMPAACRAVVKAP